MRVHVREFNAGACWPQKFSVTKNFDITTGLRADYFTNIYNDKLLNETLTSGTTLVSPKLNFNYSVSDQVQLYL